MDVVGKITFRLKEEARRHHKGHERQGTENRGEHDAAGGAKMTTHEQQRQQKERKEFPDV